MELKKVFVTGATGFIGSHFVKKCLHEGIEVIAMKRSANSKPRIDLAAEPIWLEKSYEEIEVNDFNSVDCFVHLAAYSMTYPYQPLDDCLRQNLMFPLEVFNKAIEAGVKKFVVAGSCFEYGQAGEKYENIPVTAPLQPINSYSVSKAAASLAFLQLAVEHSLDLSIHRIFHVFGEGEAAERLWPSLKKAALEGSDVRLTGGEQIRDFTPVEFVVNHLLEYSKKSFLENAPFVLNVGTGQPKSVREFCEEWWSHWKAQGELLFGEIPYRQNEVMRFVPEV